MKNKPLYLALTTVLAISTSSSAVQLVTENPQATPSGPNLPANTAAILYDQTDNPFGNGAPDQDFEAAFDAYDAFIADDFVVPNGYMWSIDGVITVGTTGGPANTVSVWFYPDNGGVPAATAACTYTGLTTFTETNGSFTVNLPTPCDLTGGTYWMAFQTQQDFAASGQHFFSNRATVSGNEAVWQNPGGGFGTSCSTWAPAGTVCGVGGGNATTPYDFLFALTGQSVVPQIPALNWVSLSGLAGGLAILSLLALRRRKKLY